MNRRRGLVVLVAWTGADEAGQRAPAPGGAMAGVPLDATAFAHRAAPLMLTIIDPFQDAAETPVHEAWVAGMYDLVARDSTGVYVNFLHREGDDRIRAAYPGGTYQRLVDLKRRWDPTNLFRNNQNIQPRHRRDSTREP